MSSIIYSEISMRTLMQSFLSGLFYHSLVDFFYAFQLFQMNRSRCQNSDECKRKCRDCVRKFPLRTVIVFTLAVVAACEWRRASLDALDATAQITNSSEITKDFNDVSLKLKLKDNIKINNQQTSSLVAITLLQIFESSIKKFIINYI